MRMTRPSARLNRVVTLVALLAALCAAAVCARAQEASNYPVYVTSSTPVTRSQGNFPPGWTFNIWIQPLPGGNANSGSYFASPDGSQKQGDIPPPGSQIIFGTPPNTLPTPQPTPTPSGTPSASPSPQPSPSPLPGSGVSETLANIAIEAQKQLQNISELIISILSDVIWYLASALASIMTILAFTRLLTDDNGGAANLLRLFFRTVFYVALFMQFTPILNGFEDAKQEILDKFKVLQTVNSSGHTETVTPTQLARIKFDLTYNKFTNTYFRELQPQQSNPDSPPGGALWDPNKPWQVNVDNTLNPNDWSAPKLYAAITIFRGIFAFVDFSIEILYGATRLAIILFGPIMFAVAIDKQTFQQATLPYIKGLIVFYILWPVVADIIRLICYMLSTVTIEAFMTPVIQRTVTETAGNPVIHTQVISDFNGYAVLASCFMMFISTIVLFRSPWIAHRLVHGQVFEAVSSSIANGISTVTGVALQQFGANVSAETEQMARMSEIEGQQSAAYTSADARRRAGDLGVEGQNLSARTQNETQYRSISTGLTAENQRANQMLGAENTRTRETAFASSDATAQRTVAGAQMSKRNADLERQNRQLTIGIDLDNQTDLNRRMMGYNMGNGLTQGVPLASGAVNLAYQPVVTRETNDNLRTRAAEQTQLAQGVQSEQNNIIGQNATANITATQTEYNRNVDAADRYRDTGYAANSAYNQTMQQVAGTNLGELNQTADRVAGMGRQSNDIIYSGDIKAADTVFAASRHAAALHRFSAQFSAATRDMDRTLQESLALNY